MTRRRHPVTGALSGLALGLGLVALSFSYGLLVRLGVTSWLRIVVVLVVFTGLGALWGTWGPARRRRRDRGSRAVADVVPPRTGADDTTAPNVPEGT